MVNRQIIRANRLGLVKAMLRRTETRFLIVGVWNTIFGYLAFVVVYSILGKHLSHGSVLTIAYIIAIFQSFYMQRRFVFGTEGQAGRELARFALVNTAVFVANLVFLPLAASATSLPILLLQAIFVFASTIVSYAAHKLYSFAR